MHRDAVEEIQNCKACQIHSKVPKMPKQDMTSVTSAWPFSEWCIDIVGPLPKTPGNMKFLVVAIDYFTKWVEAKPLASITGIHMEKFVWEHIICRFGVPHVIISDNEKQFAEGTFLKEDLVEAITVPKSSYEETPFSLTYCSKAVIPSKINVETERVEIFEASKNDERIRENLDLLEQRMEIASIGEAIHKQKIERYYSKKVRPPTFKPSECVLQLNSASKAEYQGKMGPTWEGPYIIVEAYSNGAYKLETLDG
ncbi:reverse transcriptase domain-containing protein [Tanacetum coccineum]